jgi:endonuclease YncB( thermonuclease family)
MLNFQFGMLLAAGLMAIGLAGCEKNSLVEGKNIPAGLREVASAKLTGTLSRTWGGDNFEVGQREQLHYFLLIGVDCPEPGQPFFEEACDYLNETCGKREIEMEVLSYDDFKRELGHAWVTDADGERVNLALALLSKGLGWYNDSEFEDSDRYRQTMESARTKKLGLWAQPNPTPPWEHWKKTRDEIRGER